MFWGDMSYRYQLVLTGLSLVSLKVCVSLLIFYLVDLSIGVSGVLKSLTIIVSLLISPFILLSICLTYCSTPVLGASAQFSRSVVSDSLLPHELQHASPPCPSPSPRVHSDSRPLSL